MLDERQTLELVVSGRSIARYGDGEFKICHGGAAKAQAADPHLTERMCGILHDSGECLVGIPNIRSNTPKAEFWGQYMRYAPLLKPGREYVSSFVTRPDSAPWINTPESWEMVESLWVGQDVTLVRGSGKSLVAEDLEGANSVTEIMGPRQHAWFSYEKLLRQIGTPKRAILCLGPCATIMAVDLCARGVHAIDAGHIGMFLRKYRKGLPMWVSKEDKQQEPEPAL